MKSETIINKHFSPSDACLPITPPIITPKIGCKKKKKQKWHWML
jgi:hypothetical protein